MPFNNHNKRIGILGGTFNPVHIGHLLLAQSAAERFELGRVIFMPCRVPPHKDTPSLAPQQHRMAMLEIAIEGDLQFEFSDLELQREGPSYTIDSVRRLKSVYPDYEICFIIGADTLTELHLWKDIYDLLPLCRFISFQRPGFENVRRKIRLDPPWPEKLLADLSKGVPVDISSSEIRWRLAEGMSIRYLVPAQVEMYIAEHRLYRK
jgi:nicotinate-nucleotide adenylyltransferase